MVDKCFIYLRHRLMPGILIISTAGSPEDTLGRTFGTDKHDPGS